MFRIVAIVFVFLGAIVSAQSQYQEVKLVDVTRKVESHPAVWSWDTPVFWSETVSYELRIRAEGQEYLCLYTPEIQAGGLPDTFRKDATLRARIEKRKMFLVRPSGGEIEATIVRRVR